MADDSKKKPSLAVIIAAAKGKKPMGAEPDGDEPDGDDKDEDYSGGDMPPECVECMEKFNDAAGDPEAQAVALKAFLMHLGVVSGE